MAFGSKKVKMPEVSLVNALKIPLLSLSAQQYYYPSHPHPHSPPPQPRVVGAASPNHSIIDRRRKEIGETWSSLHNDLTILPDVMGRDGDAGPTTETRQRLENLDIYFVCFVLVQASRPLWIVTGIICTYFSFFSCRRRHLCGHRCALGLSPVHI